MSTPVGTQRKKYPRGDDPAVRTRMLTLAEYEELARRIIGRFAPAAARGRLFASDDAVGYVAGRIMVADWGAGDDDAFLPTTRRGRAGKWAVSNFVGRVAVRPPDMSIDVVFRGGLSLADRSPDPRAAEAVDAEEAAEASRERIDYLDGLLRSLPRDARRCVVLHHAHGLGYKAVARLTGINHRDVRRHVRRGLAEMRRAAGATV